MMISSNGTLVRTGVSEISIVGRNTQGVRLIRLDDGERLVSVEGIESLGDDESVSPETPVAPGSEPASAPDAPNVH